MMRLKTAWIKMNEHKLQLSQAVSMLSKLTRDLNDELEDPICSGSDTMGLIINSKRKIAEQIARQFGYPSPQYVVLHAEMRTSPKWVWLHPAPFILCSPRR